VTATSRFTITVFDKVGLAVGWVALLAAGLITVKVAPTFGKMFSDFGSRIPAFTQLCLRPWFWFGIALLPFGVVADGVLRNAGMRGRATRLAIAVFLLLLLAPIFWVGMYWPVFALSSAVQ
jgi:type II secretory pathway component PulF